MSSLRTNLAARSEVGAHTRAVLFLALLTRISAIAFTLTHLPPGWFFTKGQEMHLLAASLVQGQGLSSPFGPPTGPTAMIAPAYPLFVAAVFGLFGIRSLASAVVIMVLQTLLNLATVWLILHLSRRFAGEAVATLTGTFYALSLPLVWMPTIFWETSFSTFFLLAAVAMCFEANALTPTRAWVAAGAGTAVAGLFNPALLPSLVVLWVYVAWVTHLRDAAELNGLQLADTGNATRWLGQFRRPLLAGLTFVLLFGIWPVRNARVFHAFIPTRTTVGYELWIGNRAGGDGFLNESLFPTFNHAELAAYEAQGEVRYTSAKADFATDYVEHHPGTFIRLTLLRTVRFWTGNGTRNAPIVFLLHALLTGVLGIAGLLILRRSAQRAAAPFFLIPLTLFPLPYCITHAEFRYRLVLDPLLCVLGAVTLEAVASTLRNRSRVPLAVSLSRSS